MAIREGLVGSEDRTSRDELQKNDAEAIDITEGSQVEARAVGGVKVARCAFDLAAHMRSIANGARSH